MSVELPLLQNNKKTVIAFGKALLYNSHLKRIIEQFKLDKITTTNGANQGYTGAETTQLKKRSLCPDYHLRRVVQEIASL
ncbi:40_t:CDS:2 [Ambispora gerdemannii]|uniref:40_t:CDS:1 n=1 Tax=Ambispora gerdemannii TaxID=144530 RepID=A0A9N8VTT6_9GLOM|nr:40_t:CDS:2 [Ambispora gerdemannii]